MTYVIPNFSQDGAAENRGIINITLLKNKEYFLQQENVSNKLHHVLNDNQNKIISIDEIVTETEAVDSFYKKSLKDYNKEIYDLFWKQMDFNK